MRKVMVCARTSAHRMLRNVCSIYTYIGAWFCSFIQEPGEPKPVQSAPLETAPSLESPPQELDVVQYMSCTCVQRMFSIFAVVFGISISSLAVFRPPTIPQRQHQEVAAPVQQSGKVETHKKELGLETCFVRKVPLCARNFSLRMLSWFMVLKLRISGVAVFLRTYLILMRSLAKDFGI